MHRLLDTSHRTTEIDRTCGIVQVADGRMGYIVRAEDLFRFARLVRHPAVGDGHGCQDYAF